MWRCIALGLLIGMMSKEVQATIVSASLSHAGQSIQRKGQWYRFTLGQLTQESPGTVTRLSWQIRSLAAWPQPPSVLLCCNRDCQRIDSVAGGSLGFVGKGSQGVWSIAVALPGTGAQQPPFRITGVLLTIDQAIP